MQYREFLNFEPIDTVIQLRDADAKNEAQKLVDSYVISDRMASQLADVVIPQLQLDVPRDTKGILVVGNYGTGKSHLMSVLSAVAEHEELVSSLTNEQARSAAAAIGGRFKVARVEIGSVESSLRDIIVRELEDALESWGVSYKFPSANELTNNKNALIGAVAALQEKFPDHGLLLVVDELLDYLRARHEQQIILDLGFLRELGEVAELTQFRFIGGLQEALFDNPRFGFVVEQLRRVRDRFEQVLIARQDISFVVANRILKKNDEQQARIIEHLRPFTPLYGELAERMDEYAELFPIHPAYLETFQNVAVAEKREVLRTFSHAVASLLDKEVPADQPGLISFDHYWSMLKDNPSMRAYPEIAEVLDKGSVLDNRIAHGFTRKQLTPMARRIIHALSVHRLTTGSDITTPIGLTPEELKDDLCLYVQTPEANADFLLGQVRVALREIVRTVSGQYISHNDGNDQYYLDVKKDIDFDAKIDERGQTLGPDDLNRYFFDALREALGFETSTYVTGHRIWSYELPWPDHRVTRPGYLFFGAPNERSTAQPPRDFYVFLLPPFHNQQWADEGREDEVTFVLGGLDETFEGLLRNFAGSSALEADSASHREVYRTKASDHRRRLLSWINTHLVEHLEVLHQCVRQPATAVLPRATSSASESIEDLVRIVASTQLVPHFADIYPDYPRFTRLQQPITEQTRQSNAMEAIQQIAGRPFNQLGRAVLDGLELLQDNDRIAPDSSRYAQELLKRLLDKPDQQVVNRLEIIEVIAGGVDRPVEKDLIFRLEPEWIAVALIALVHYGDVTLTVNNKETLDAGSVERAAMMSIEAIANFQHFGRPRQVPIRTWETIFEHLSLQPALVKDEFKRDQAVRELIATVEGELKRIATLETHLANGLRLWNEDVFTDNFRIMSEGDTVVGITTEGELLTTTDIRAALREYKEFLNEIAKFNTPGKLRNLRLQRVDAMAAFAARDVVKRGEALVARVQRLQPLTTYLVEARANLPANHPWSREAARSHRALLDEIRCFGKGEDVAHTELQMVQQLERLKTEYIDAYATIHREAVLNAADDDRRRHLYEDSRLKAMDTLTSIDLIDRSTLTWWKNTIRSLPMCPDFHEGRIDATPTCPSCELRPSARPTQTPAVNMLQTLDDRLSTLLLNARKALRDALMSETAQTSLGNMPSERAPVDAFLEQRDDDPDIPAGFARSATMALRGLQALSLPVEDLLTALETGGMPCTLEELKRRFDGFIRASMRGHDPRGTRLMFKRADAQMLGATDKLVNIAHD